MRLIAGALFALALLAGCSRPTEDRTVTVAAASDLQFALDEAVAAYRAEHPGVEVKVSYGSSGNFLAQISNGAPYDLFFSADVAYPRQLVDKQFADASTLVVYAVGRIVVWVPKSSPLDVERLGIATLTDPRVRRVSIANPQHAPYGRAAEAAMRSLGVYDEVAPKLVLGESVSQAAQFVESGAADAGVIALSLALAPVMQRAGRYWEVPADAHPRLEQGAVVTSNAKDRAAAGQFLSFVARGGGKAVLARYGFTVPES
jgi:molybdate transport system substrate-binding protein